MTTKTIVVVGASRGIGKELVLIFAKNPSYRVIALSRNSKAMEVFTPHPNVEYHTLDLNTPDLQNRLEILFLDVNQIDILINNAGKLINKSFLEITAQDFSDCFQVNVIGVMQTVQALLPKMLNQGAHIVNISSMGGFQGSAKFPGLTAYSSSKAAVCNFTELFAEEHKDTLVKMNCLCLGAVQTEMLQEAFPGYQAPFSALKMATYIAEFAETGQRYFNGKIIPVSVSTP